MDISGLSSVYTDYLNQQIDNAQASRIQSAVSQDYTQAADDELMDVCKQFEAYFLEQVFKEMEKTTLADEEESDSASALVDYFKESAIAELAEQSTESQGLGIAQMLYEQMKRNYEL